MIDKKPHGKTCAAIMGITEEAAELLKETLDEEEATDEKLTEIAEDVVNQEAEAASAA